jgi:YD repeat-containing protein
VSSTGLPSNGLEPAAQSWYAAGTNQFTDTTNYDAAGNRMWMSPYTLTYDAENRIVSAASQMNGSTTYAYDGDGNRVLALFTGGTYTLYVNDANGELGAEYSTNATATPGTQYLSVDQLGSTRVTTDGSENVTGRFDYLPFGLETGALGLASRRASQGYGTVGPRLKFTGKAFDTETGLDFFGARYFSGAQRAVHFARHALGRPIRRRSSKLEPLCIRSQQPVALCRSDRKMQPGFGRVYRRR